MDLTEDISSVALTVVIAVLSVATLLVGLRIYTRLVLLKQMGWDDYCILTTLASALVCGGVSLSTIPYGLGRHTSTLDPTIIPNYLEAFWLSIVFYNLTLSLLKFTFLFQYYRVLAVHKMKKVIWIIGIVIMMWAVSQLLVVIFTCNPVQKFWQTDLPGHCIPNLPFWYINAAGNIATDLAIFIMPLPVLGKLQLRRKQKYFLLGIFSLGFFTCAISLIRLAYLKQGPDFTFDNVPTSCWSLTELACGISCACLPTLKPLLSKVKPRWITSYAMRTQQTGRGTGRDGRSRYGKGTFHKSQEGHGTELKSTHKSTRTGHDSILTISTVTKNYTMLKDDDDVERGTANLMPPSPTYQANERSPHNSGDESISSLKNVNPQPGSAMGWNGDGRYTPQPSLAVGTMRKDSDKAMGLLGITGVSTHVSSGRSSVSFPRTDGMDSSATGALPKSGIEVKHSVIVETTSSTEMMWGNGTPRAF